MANLTSAAQVVVLVVEDDAIVRMLAADMVEEAGFAALEAENADEAVRVLESRPDIRIVFSDIDMPGSMDGLRLAVAVRGRWPPIEVVLTSGHRAVSVGDLPDRCVFIPKPYEPKRLVATLRRLAA